MSCCGLRFGCCAPWPVSDASCDAVENFLVALFGMKKAVAIAAFFGAVVSLRYVAPPGWHRSPGGWCETIYLVAAGWMIATQAAPAIGAWQQLSPPVENGIAFLLGLFGISLAGALSDLLKKTELIEVIKAWRPGGSK